MNWYLVTYADDKFKDQQEFLNRIHKDSFVLSPYTRRWLETTEFYSENKDLLDEPTGNGWWAWKPYVILQAMESAKNGDFIVYSDCGDMFSPGLKSYVKNTVNDEDACLLLIGNNKNGQYTKRDCFVLMECDEEDYWNSQQLEVGFMVWKVCDQSQQVISEWLKYCLNSQIIDNDPSTLGEDLDGFVAHRNDQSILTNLAIKEGLTVAGPEYRNFIECDYDYWYERGSKGYGREIDSFLMSIKDA
jgi:hypothetical protein